jgi:type II secretory pathway pseudopilin PulG
LAGLVVVLACVALLGFMLLPALTRAKDKQAIQVDLENLRQLTQASQMYAADSGGFEPAPGWGTTANAWLYAANLPPGSQGSISSAQLAYTNQLSYLQKGQLWPYVKSPRVFTCPSDSTNTLSWSERNVLTTSYGMNAAVCGYGGLGDGRSYFAALFGPDRIQMWEVDDLLPFYFNDGSNYPYEGITGRHRNFPFSRIQYDVTTVGNGGVLGNFDGSAEIMSIGDFYKISGTQFPSPGATPNRLWCNPGDPGGG